MSHDPRLILTNGDGLEQYWGIRILNSIPSYATIWATYIGNDGNQNFLPMPGADDNAQKERLIFWQRLYTLFESLALCWEIESQFKTRDRIATYEGYALNLNLWTAFYAHLGRIHDMAEKITERLKQKSLFFPFDPFYQKRHIALHGIKVPMCYVENVLCAPVLGDQWHLKMQWGELRKDHFDFLSKQVTDTLGELEPVVESFCVQVLNLVSSRLGLKDVSWPALVRLEVDAEANVVFENTQSPALNSGVENISGFFGQRDHSSGVD